MLINTIIAPLGAPQVHGSQLSQAATVFDALDDTILNQVRAHGRYGLTIWQLVNKIASARNPSSRQEARSIRLQVLQRIPRLLKLAHLFRVGRIAVSVVQLPRLSVTRKRRSYRGSTVSRRVVDVQQSVAKLPKIKLLQGNNCAECVSSATEKTKSDVKAKNQQQFQATLVGPSTDVDRNPVENNEHIRAAGIALARLRSHPKRKWSGFVNGSRVWRGRKILLANGVQGYSYGARRGKVVWSFHSNKLIGGLCGEPWQWGVLPQDCVTVVKDEAAVTLGRMKFGRKERQSDLKRQTARTNGCKPCREGRKRGRPSKSGSKVTNGELNTAR